MGNSLHSRILVLGIDGAGKTSFINRIEHPNQNIAVTPTEAYKVHDIKVKGVKFNVWDVAGKESTRSLWKHYFQQGGTDAIIWVVDSASSEEKLNESKQCLTNAMMDPALQGYSRTLFLNCLRPDFFFGLGLCIPKILCFYFRLVLILVKKMETIY
jgi:small GTP-binding protein